MKAELQNKRYFCASGIFVIIYIKLCTITHVYHMANAEYLQKHKTFGMTGYRVHAASGAVPVVATKSYGVWTREFHGKYRRCGTSILLFACSYAWMTVELF